MLTVWSSLKSNKKKMWSCLQANVSSGESECDWTRSPGHVQCVAWICTDWSTQVRKLPGGWDGHCIEHIWEDEIYLPIKKIPLEVPRYRYLTETEYEGEGWI